MKKKKNIQVDLKVFVIVIVIIVIFALSIFGMYFLFPKISNEKQADYWMELLVVVFSSLLSAGVAYCVAVIQTSNSINREREEENNISYNRINLLKIEVRDNYEVLEKVKNNNFPPGSSDLLKSQISTKILDMYFDKILVSDDVIEKIIQYNKKMTLFINLESENMSLIYQQLSESINELLSELDKK